VWIPMNRLFTLAVTAALFGSAGFTRAKTIDAWPPGDHDPSYFLVLFRK
jgi:hypothetical protein